MSTVLMRVGTLRKSADQQKVVSAALTQARSQVKDFMTDSQKAFILGREGKSFMDSGDLRGAIECFSEGISFNPSIVLFNQRATCHKLLEMSKEAYFDYCLIIRMEPEVGSHFCNRGLVLAKMKKIDMALEDLDVAIQYDPSPNHYYSRAVTYSEFGKYDLAIADFIQALGDESATNLSEFKLRCKYRRALAYFEIQKFEDTVKDTNDILLQDPNSVQARALLGRALKILHDHKKAEEQLSVAIVLDPNQAALYTERGDIRFRTGQRNKIIEAIYDFDKAAKILESKLAERDQQSMDGLTSGSRRFQRAGSIISQLSLRNSTMVGSRSSPALVGNNSGKHRLGKRGLNRNNSSAHRLDGSVMGRGDAPNREERDRIGEMINPDVFQRNLAAINAAATAAGVSAPPSRQVSLISQAPSVSASTVERGTLPPGAVMPTNYYSEVEDQLADTLFKRAQAKLMTEADAVNIEAALADALKAVTLNTADDDYQMVAATCYIRLNRYAEALNVLQGVLNRSPKNYKALYHLSFCQRAIGSQKDAIEGLTQIIANSSEYGSLAEANQSVSIHRIFEMRGTLFHEIQAHKLALSDFGKAIAYNPIQADNYYLRGDCHSKMGNYEQALNDFDQAERHMFEDKCSLYIARGGVRRLLGQSRAAAEDYRLAYDLIERNDKIGKVRILSFRAFCQIDEKMYATAYDSLIVAMQFNKEVILEKMSKYTKDEKKIDEMVKKFLYKSSGSWHANPLSDLEGDMLYLKRVEWILNYHIALSLYMQEHFVHAEELLNVCLLEENRKFVADDLALGALLFFLAQCQIHSKKFEEAAVNLEECGRTHWIDKQHHQFIRTFALAKIYQCQKKHTTAIEIFDRAMLLSPDNAHCHFRRAWSHKAMGNYALAGDDFETAKNLQPDDPNFAILYKNIAHCEYMCVESEPDLVEVFPALLPVPGMGTRA